MKKIGFVITLTLAALAGCVKETTIIGKNSVKQEDAVDRIAASNNRVQLGMGYLEKGQMPTAKYNFDQAIALNPSSIEAHLALAYYYENVGDLESTDSTYRKLMSLDGRNPDVLNNYGTFLCRQKNYVHAEELFLKAVEQPDYVKIDNTYENAGLCAAQSGDSAKAEKYFKLAYGYNPQQVRLLLDLADLSLSKKQPSQALSWIQQFKQKTGTDTADSLWIQLLAANQLGRIADVHVFGQALVSQFPSSAQAKKYQNNDY